MNNHKPLVEVNAPTILSGCEPTKKNKYFFPRIGVFFVIIFNFSIICVSCEQRAEKNQKDGKKSTDWEYSGGMWGSMDYSVSEKTIDSCEYIIIFGVNGRSIIHKANCDNPFHETHNR